MIQATQAIHTRSETSPQVRTVVEFTEYGQPQPDTPVQIVLAYDGDAAFQAATKICRAVTGSLNDQFDFREDWIPFHAITEPATAERAAKAAARADVIFCCPNNPNALPEAVRNWIRLCLAGRSQPDTALVLMLPSSPACPFQQATLAQDFQQMARANGVAFFVTGYAPAPSRIMESHPTQRPFLFGKEPVRVHPNDLASRHWAMDE